MICYKNILQSAIVPFYLQNVLGNPVGYFSLNIQLSSNVKTNNYQYTFYINIIIL